MKPIYLSEEGLKKLQKELAELKNIKRKEVIKRIQEARSYGDLAENTEYDSAKDEQAFIEGRILELENLIKKAKVISKSRGEKVAVGNTIRLIDETGQEETFTLVSRVEADPYQGKISYDSPLGAALLGKSVGEEVRVKVPSGERRYKIVQLL